MAPRKGYKHSRLDEDTDSDESEQSYDSTEPDDIAQDSTQELVLDSSRLLDDEINKQLAVSYLEEKRVKLVNELEKIKSKNSEISWLQRRKVKKLEGNIREIEAYLNDDKKENCL